jgi:hypothetical protein
MAFGDDNPFAASSSGGGGGGRKRQNRGGNNRHRHNAGGGGGGGKKDKDKKDPTLDDPVAEGDIRDDPFAPSDLSSGDPFGAAVIPGDSYGASRSPLDTGAGSDAFNQRENYYQGLWGMLNQAGVSQDAVFGGNQAAWADEQVKDWIDQYEGLALTTNEKLPFENFVYGLPGGERLGMPAKTPGTIGADPFTSGTLNANNSSDPTLIAANQAPLGEEDGAGDFGAYVREQTGKGKGQLNKGRRKRLRGKFDALEGTAPATSPPPSTTPGVAPGSPAAPSTPGAGAWRQDTWAPAMRDYLTRRWDALTPTARGYDSTQWNAPRRVIQF